MKALLMSALAAVVLSGLSGCIVYDRDGGHHHRGYGYGERHGDYGRWAH